MTYKVKVLNIKEITHNVKRIRIEKPKDYQYIPGQATIVSVIGRGRKGPLTLSGLNSDKFLEFNVKIYPEHKRFTFELDRVTKDQSIKIHDPFGTISYKGQGLFIAGGTGITPFLAILRELKKNGEVEGNKLIFSNRTSKDIILKQELELMFKENLKELVFVLSKEKLKNYEYGRVNEGLLKKYIKDLSKYFYVCGPPEFVFDVRKMLKKIGVDSKRIVYEKDY